MEFCSTLWWLWDVLIDIPRRRNRRKGDDDENGTRVAMRVCTGSGRMKNVGERSITLDV